MSRAAEDPGLAPATSDARHRGQAQTRGMPAPAHGFIPGASVVLLRPRKLRGTIGVVRRRIWSGWEVEIRSPEGIPLHLTLPERALHLRS